MWIGIGVGELVVNAMITSPDVYTVKEQRRITEDQQGSKLPGGLVAFMCPQTMRTNGCPQSSSRHIDVG